MKRSQEVRAQHERTIKAQQIRIERLLSRLEVLASASGGQKKRPRSERGVRDPSEVNIDGINEETVKRDEREELVPIALYNKLQDEVRGLQESIGQKETLIHEKDAAVEVCGGGGECASILPCVFLIVDDETAYGAM